jgi:hypothetical protein
MSMATEPTDPVALVLTMVGAMSADEKQRVIDALSPPKAVATTFVKAKGGTRRVWMRTVARIDHTKRGIEKLEGEWCGDTGKVPVGALVLMGERWPTRKWHLMKRVYGAGEIEVGGEKVAGVEVLLRDVTDFEEVVRVATSVLEPSW